MIISDNAPKRFHRGTIIKVNGQDVTVSKTTESGKTANVWVDGALETWTIYDNLITKR